MDQQKIGKFILEERKKKGYTQKQLADKLSISDKTVSKWENGNGIPDISLLLPLCEEFGISVNELLSGECLTDTEYKQKAEENIMKLVQNAQTATYRPIISLWKMCFRICFFVALTLLIITMLSFFLVADITAPWLINCLVWTVLGCIAKIVSEMEYTKLKKLKKSGICTEAQITKLLPSALFRVGNYVTCRIQCTSSIEGQSVAFQSGYVLLTHFDTKENLKAVVYYDAKNTQNYCVELLKTD